MRICIPTSNNEGLNSEVYGHFGSAPYFMIYNTSDNTIEVINNKDKHHEHGKCNPLLSFENKKIDIVVTGGIGAGAIHKLNEGGIRVLKTSTETTIQDIIQSYQKNKLKELTMQDVCDHHHDGEYHH